MISIADDIRDAARGLARVPAFALTATLILALGIGAATVMFAIVRGVLLRPLPVPQESRIILAWKHLPSGRLAHHPFGDREIEAARRASRLLEAVAGVDANGAGRQVMVEDGEATDVVIALVAGPFFQVLEVDAVLGRTLTAADDVDGAEGVVVISHGLWLRRYGAAKDVIGRRVTLGGERLTWAMQRSG